MPTCLIWWAAMLVSAGLLVTGSVSAQSPKLEQYGKHVDAPTDDELDWNISAGGVLNTGNTESFQVNGGSHFRLVRGRHGLTADLIASHGQAVVDQAEGSYQETARNVRAGTRYDFFLTRLDAVFGAHVLRHDPFAGLDLRLQWQVGYQRNFFREEKHRFWGEAGYDLTYDNFDPDPLLDDLGNELAGHDVLHSLRGFVGYENRKSENLVFLTGVEGLLNVEDTEDLRVTWQNALRSSLGGAFQLELRLLLQFDSEPVSGKKKLDTTTQINLIYTLVSEKA